MSNQSEQSPQQSSKLDDAQTQEMLKELKVAYKSINTLKDSMSHKKIVIELEKKMKKAQD